MSARAHVARAASRALSGLAASPVTSVIATGTIALCLLLAGAFALLLVNMERVLVRFGEEVRVSAYLSDELAPEAQEQLAAAVRRLPDVETVALVSKQAALERFRASPFGRASLLDGLDDNPLPASLEIVLAPAQRSRAGVDALLQRLGTLQGIDELGYGHEWVEGYARAVTGVRGIALALGFHAVTASFADGLALLLGSAQPVFFAARQALAGVAFGAALGALGSAFAVLRVQRP